MSYEASEWAYKQQGLTGAQKAVLVAIAFRAREKHGETFAFPGHELLTEMTCLSRRTISRALNDLESQNYLQRVRRNRGNGSRTSDKYILNIPRLSATVTPSQSANVTHSGQEPKCHCDTPQSATVSDPKCHCDTPLIEREYKEMNIQPSPASDETGNQELEILETEISPPDQPAPTAQTLIAEWIDGIGYQPPGRVVGHLSKEIKNLLDEGYPYEQVREAVVEWNRKGLHPSTLPSILNSQLNQRTISRQNSSDSWAELGGHLQTYAEQKGWSA